VAQQAGLSRSSKPTLFIQGDDRVGLSDVFYRAIADAGLNIDFVVAQAVGAHFSVVVGFATESDSDRAAKLIKEVAREWERSGGAHDTPN
jgi:predicted amino acid-binding ACT domain protein